MVNADPLKLFTSYFLSQSPALLALLVGAVFALVWWRRYPRPARLVLLGLSIQLVGTLAANAMQAYAITVYPPTRIAVVLGATGLARSVAYAIGTGLLVLAAFTGRDEARLAAFPIAPAIADPAANVGH
jgi:hypothetical protein